MADRELQQMLDKLTDKPKLSIIRQPPQKYVDDEGPNIALDLVKKFEEQFDNIRVRDEQDRAGLKDVIKYLEGLVFKSGQPKAAWLEQLVAGYRTMVDSNISQIRALDSLSKLLQAGKGTSISNKSKRSAQDEVLELIDAPSEDETV